MLRVLLAVAVVCAGCLTPPAPAAPAPEAPAAPRPADPEAPPPAAASLRYVHTGRGGGLGEPNLAVSPKGTLFATAWDETVRSRDHGATWEVVHDFRATAPGDAASSGDPTLWFDAVTARLYVAHLFRGCSHVFWSDDEGGTWPGRSLACLGPAQDHEKLATGRPGPDGNPLAGRDHPTVVYLCYSRLVTTNCLVSYDGGRTWPLERVVAAADGTCDGIAGHPAVAADGTVALAKTNGCDALVVYASRDSGATWTRQGAVDAVGGEGLDPELAFAPDGTLYALWQGRDHAKYLARSGDVGATWAGPWRVSPAEVRSTEFMALAAGGDGRVAAAFLGTRDSDATGAAVADDARWHLFLAYAENATADAPAFDVHQVSRDDDPVQIGCVTQSTSVRNVTVPKRCLNHGHFIDGAVGPDGTFHAAANDGCTAGCAGNGNATADDSRATETTVAWRVGWSLFGAGASAAPTATRAVVRCAERPPPRVGAEESLSPPLLLAPACARSRSASSATSTTPRTSARRAPRATSPSTRCAKATRT